MDALAPIPSSISFEQAAVLPLAISTAAVVLYQKDQLDLPHPSESAKNLGDTILNWVPALVPTQPPCS